MPEIINPREHDLGGFKVRRALPDAKRRRVGPFVFFDHMGPHRFPVGEGIAVRPHPHIGLATVTYLWEGAISHRDSLGSQQDILPGDVNWMIAGRGIVHSERSPERFADQTHPIHGLQTWIALPEDRAEMAPAFEHHPAASLPSSERDGVRLVCVAGHGFGLRSPVSVQSDTLYVAIDLAAGAALPIPPEHVERALYLVEGEAELDAMPLPPWALVVLDADTTPVLRALSDCRLMLCGGAPLGPRFVWWNFVASSRERIEQAKLDWSEGRFERVPGETEFIPLPDK
ncbi:pirin family protein [Aquimonas sp.]|jgi:redox-sensitive bicupin YhaK (pirin superfamily)|uniref:pirin family protein n=1 Tax=Aquimonas sp. TaxID=1872588 RepID=UPI0037BF7C54